MSFVIMTDGIEIVALLSHPTLPNCVKVYAVDIGDENVVATTYYEPIRLPFQLAVDALWALERAWDNRGCCDYR